MRTRTVICSLLVVALSLQMVSATPFTLRLSVTSALPTDDGGNIPMDPLIDFGNIISQNALPGVLDPNSIEVWDVAGAQPVDFLLEEFDGGDAGRVEWQIRAPSFTSGDTEYSRDFDIRFSTVTTRPELVPPVRSAQVGVGDLLRYNAGVPRPVAPIYLAGLADMTGDGKRDLVGTWNYAHRPGDPWDGMVVFPRVGSTDSFEFGDMLRQPELPDQRYMRQAIADLNGDGHTDVIASRGSGGGDSVDFYLHSGQQHPSTLADLTLSSTVSRGTSDKFVHVGDIDADGDDDLIISGNYKKNNNGNTWPLLLYGTFSHGIAGIDTVLYDVDKDGKLDAVSLITDPADPGLGGRKVVWQPNEVPLPGGVVSFGSTRLLSGIFESVRRPVGVAAVREGDRQGILILHDNWQKVTFFEEVGFAIGQATFQEFGQASSLSAVMAVSDQSSPYPTDWDGDGDWDLLVGGGYGWPRILINEGTSAQPSFTEPQLIHADGEPIRFIRNEILGPPDNSHNMGYPFPVSTDWNDDGLPDLVIPNETNRIFWYENVGTRENPQFGPQQQVLVDGYPDSPALRQVSAVLANSSNPSGVYPVESNQPFYWRTGAALADFNDDGLMDLATLDGFTRNLTLYTRWEDTGGELRLSDDGELKLTNGSSINQFMVGRTNGWTQSFDAVDWDDDGLMDIVWSLAGRDPGQDSVYLLRNVGTSSDPVFAQPVGMRAFGEPIGFTRHGPHVGVGDMDGDGKPDIVGMTEWSVLPFFSHEAIEMNSRPSFQLQLETGPTRVWSNNVSGDWGDSTNWSGGSPNGTDHIAIFGSAIQSARTVFADDDVIVAAIQFDNANQYVIAGPGSVVLDTGVSTVDATIEVFQGVHQFQAPVDLRSDTHIEIAASAELTFNNALHLNGNTFNKTGAGELAIRNDLYAAGGSLNLADGVISGTGPFDGDLRNMGGILSPGNSPGVLEITGSYAQGAQGTLLIELGGVQPGVSHDVLRVDGPVALAGTLSVSLIDDFQPAEGDRFQILDTTSVSGTFAEMQLPFLGDGVVWNTSSLYDEGVLSLMAVSEPGGFAPLLLGLLAAVKIQTLTTTIPARSRSRKTRPYNMHCSLRKPREKQGIDLADLAGI